MSLSAAEYKKLKENFVSGLTGGSVNEICKVTALAPVAILAWSILQSRLSIFHPYTPIAFVADFFLNVCVFLMATTLHSSMPGVLAAVILAPTALAYIFPLPKSRRKAKPPPVKRKFDTESILTILPNKPFLTAYRGAMMVATVIAILAVDFRVFPRRFAKVETWGTSLMDLGVGSFVFSAGIVAARPVYRQRAECSEKSLAVRMVYALRHSVPLLVLGTVRLISVKGLDYAEHVTEYGVHWNFFFTLAFLPPFVALFQSALRLVPSYALLAIFIATAYQVALETTTLKIFILRAPRVDLLSMNREGIFSFIGYLAIFLAGQDMGMFLLPRQITKSGSGPGSQRNTLLLTMAVWSMIWTLLYFLATDLKYGLGLDVSRRMANLPYVFLVAAFNSAQLLALCIVETIYFPAVYNASDIRTERAAYDNATSKVLHAYNRNGLVLFLLANILTGIINLSVRTLEIGTIGSMTILLAYVGTITGVALALDYFNISIKL